jgi:NAD(P)-dependent dehydrogenase (short-subunit alcohol dehydrogenase family)
VAVMDKPVCVVVGVGPGNGASIARRFATGGHRVALLARSSAFSESLAGTLDGARFYTCDVAKEGDIAAAFARVSDDLGEPEVVVYNAGSGVWGDVETITPAGFEAAWRVNALGAFITARQVIPAMKRRGGGAIILIGATASRRGMPRTAAFAPAKAAQRSLAESMARHLWPVGVHVALVIVDGVVDLEHTRKTMPDKPDSFFVNPDDVAATVFWLSQQPRSAWAFEVEARPFGEIW